MNRYAAGLHKFVLLHTALGCITPSCCLRHRHTAQTVNTDLVSSAPMYVRCRLNAENESGARENAGKLLTHIGRSRMSPLTSLLPSPQHLQPMLEKAFAAQQGMQLKQVCWHNSQHT